MRERGFTLIEIVAALFLLALGFGLLLQTLAAGLALARRGAEESELALVAQSLLDRLGADFPLEPGELRGELGESLRYRLEMREETPPGGGEVAAHPLVLLRVRLELSPRTGAGAVFETLRVAPRRS
ncbi:MAG: prepilin-type N-terminal cleavage/methylation domain-containing protein [Xanthomonadales bacterium]|nr:prepilin-type N-terminal cleavage/methylation domain-containing protein [Xanthomonadales bacterium]